MLTPLVFSLLQSLLGDAPWPYSRVFGRVALVVACGPLYLRPYYRGWRQRGDWRRLALGMLLTSSFAALTLPLLA